MMGGSHARTVRTVRVRTLDGTEVRITHYDHSLGPNSTGVDVLFGALSTVGITPWFVYHVEFGEMLVELYGLNTGPAFGYTVDVDFGEGYEPISTSLANIPASDIGCIAVNQVEEDSDLVGSTGGDGL